jgi:hypothetical protein
MNLRARGSASDREATPTYLYEPPRVTIMTLGYAALQQSCHRSACGDKIRRGAQILLYTNKEARFTTGLCGILVASQDAELYTRVFMETFDSVVPHDGTFWACPWFSSPWVPDCTLSCGQIP